MAADLGVCVGDMLLTGEVGGLAAWAHGSCSWQGRAAGGELFAEEDGDLVLELAVVVARGAVVGEPLPGFER